LLRRAFFSSLGLTLNFQQGDLVTITSREELRLAEAELEAAEMVKRGPVAEALADEGSPEESSKVDKPQVQQSKSAPEFMRLHIVEVSPEQEPPVPDDDDVVDTTEDILEEEEPEEELSVEKVDSTLESEVDPPENEEVTEAKSNKSGKKEDGQPAGEEMEIDDWLFDFAQLFRTHVGEIFFLNPPRG
jgi:hypothetical protein